MGEDSSSGPHQPRGFKDRKVDELRLYGLLQQLLIRQAPFLGWHLINVPPVCRWCSGSWRQQEGDRRVSGSADGWHSKKQLSCHNQSSLAFTRSWNTRTVLPVTECSLLSVIQFLFKEELNNPWLNQPLSATKERQRHRQESGTDSTGL